MLTKAAFSFSAKISGAASEGQIIRIDGKTVHIDGQELPLLMKDLVADGAALPNRAKHHQLVLGEWFARKDGRQHLRLVS